MTDLHAVNVFADEGAAFADRHPDLSETGRSWGATMWGLLRAVAECPDCPGHFRVFGTYEGKDAMYCAQCGGLWLKQDEPPQKQPQKRKRRT